MTRVYVVVGAGYWGKALTLKQAEREWEVRAGQKVKALEKSVAHRGLTLGRLAVEAEDIKAVYVNDNGALVRPRGSTLWYMERDANGLWNAEGKGVGTG